MFINIDLTEVKEPSIVPEGDYNVVVSNAELLTSEKTGREMIRLAIEVDGHPNAQTIFEYLSLPREGDEPRTAQMLALNLKRALAAFGLDTSGDGFEIADLVGARADNIHIVQDEYEGRLSNKVQFPRLAN